MPTIDERVWWAYGVTTVPGRRSNLLQQTLASLRNAGFDKPRLFVDGDRDGTSWEQEFKLEVTVRYPNIRTHGNWFLSLTELFIRHPECQRYAIFQDDFVTCQNLRRYLNRCEYPKEGYWNLYTFPQNQSLCPEGGNHIGWYPSNQMGRGAVALVFDQDCVIKLLSQTHMIMRPIDQHRGWKAVDGGIVTALKKEGYTEFVHNPSLVQHTGRNSSMGNRIHPLAVSFRGESFDACSLLAKAEH